MSNPETTSDGEAGLPTEVGDGPLSGSQKASVVSARFEGPIPPPETLAHYRQIDPAIVDWILTSSRDERVRRYKLEAATVDATTRYLRAGQICALVTVVLALGAASWVAYLGHGWPAAVLGSAWLAPVVYTFVKGKGGS